MRTVLSLLIFQLIMICFDAEAQTHIGISLNIGNRQQFDPDSKGFTRALAPSPSLFINQRRVIAKHWMIQYGVTAGIVAYNLKVVGIDSLSLTDDVFPFPEYSTLFGSADVVLGPQFLIGKHSMMVSVGGGTTCYASASPVVTYQIEIADPDNNTLDKVFDARMTAPANTFSFFWKVATYYDISASFAVGAEFVYHMKPAVEGEYQFYHTKTPQSGNIEVYQREFRIAFSYRLRNRKGDGSNH